MATDAGFREGARSGDPLDVCPGCGESGCIFASDFKMMGRHSIRACAKCGKVFENGKPRGALDVHGAKS